MIIMRKGLKAKVIESHRPIKSLMDFKKKWESTKGCSNAEGLLSNIDELLKGRYQKKLFFLEPDNSKYLQVVKWLVLY